MCNFLAGNGNAGNEIWWNGGSGSSKIGLKGYVGKLPDSDVHLLQRQ